MGYEKQTWATGDVITAEKLNHMEDGIEGAGEGGATVLRVTLTYTSQTQGTLSHTYQQIADAVFGGAFVYMVDDGGNFYHISNVHALSFDFLVIGTDDSGDVTLLIDRTVRPNPNSNMATVSTSRFTLQEFASSASA